MFLMDLFWAVLFGLLWSVAFALIARRKRRATGFYRFFIILFLITWMGGIWAAPGEATESGRPWLPFFTAGLIAILVLAMFVPGYRPPTNRQETLELLEQVEEDKNLKSATYTTVGVFFWLLLAVLVTSIAYRYLIA